MYCPKVKKVRFWISELQLKNHPTGHRKNLNAQNLHKITPQSAVWANYSTYNLVGAWASLTVV